MQQQLQILCVAHSQLQRRVYPQLYMQSNAANNTIFHQYSTLQRFTQGTCLQFFILSIGWKDTPGPLGFIAFRGPKYAVYYEAVVAQVQEEEEDNHAGEGDLAESHCTPLRLVCSNLTKTFQIYL